jgi:16S rRNA (cytosine967-C5)-methyltransferase
LASTLPALPDPRDRALTEAIVFAALRDRARYDAALAMWMPKPPGRRDGELRALLWAGFAQLDALGLPPHAAVDATVASARGRAGPRTRWLPSMRDRADPATQAACWPIRP